MRKLGFHAAVIAALLVVFGMTSYAIAGSGKSRVKADEMIGYLEAPSISTVASGNFEATIDDAADEIDYTLSYQNLEGTITQAHIHFAQRGVSGGISAWLCESPTNPSPSPTTPVCPQSGTVTGTITPDEVVGPANQGIAAREFEELVAAIRAGRAYANVHSSKFGGGEIRGQIDDRNQRDD